jgi:hypothetical protein
MMMMKMKTKKILMRLQMVNQKLLTQIEVKDHIEKLWAKEKDLLDLMFGRYYPSIDDEPY